MPNPYGGQPALVEFNLPAAVNISSSTNASPIVITTATDHNLNPGDYFVVIGAQDPALATQGGVWRAGTVATNTVAVLYRDGNPLVGTLSGGAQGTLQATGYGSTVNIISGGDRPLTSSWNVPFAALLDRAAWLEYLINFGRKRRRPRVVLPQAGPHTIDVTQGDIFELHGSPTSPPVNVILASVTPVVPAENERIEVLVPSISTGVAAYAIRRVDTTLIATFQASSGSTMWAQFEFVGGVWRLAGSSGTYDDSGLRGVIPGAGA